MKLLSERGSHHLLKKLYKTATFRTINKESQIRTIPPVRSCISIVLIHAAGGLIIRRCLLSIRAMNTSSSTCDLYRVTHDSSDRSRPGRLLITRFIKDPFQVDSYFPLLQSSPYNSAWTHLLSHSINSPNPQVQSRGHGYQLVNLDLIPSEFLRPSLTEVTSRWAARSLHPFA